MYTTMYIYIYTYPGLHQEVRILVDPRGQVVHGPPAERSEFTSITIIINIANSMITNYYYYRYYYV